MAHPKQHGLWFHLVDVLFNIVIIVAVVAAIRTFLVSPFQVEGSSMSDTLENNEYIIINKLAYYIGTPDRGDIVVFRPPTDPSRHYVKRVIGLPGDKIVIRNGDVFVQKAGAEELTELPEPYLNDRNQGKTYRHPPGSADTSEVRYEVPEGQYFVLGDNRQGSLDSRSFMGNSSKPEPYVPLNYVSGKVWVIALPISKIHAFQTPDYGL